MTESQFSSLKNQISPHFLFNSLNTLTSLMYEDRDLASDFVSRLAASYRYILDNREKDLTLLANEIQFLDTFIFMIIWCYSSVLICQQFDFFLRFLSRKKMASLAFRKLIYARNSRPSRTKKKSLKVSVLHFFWRKISRSCTSKSPGGLLSLLRHSIGRKKNVPCSQVGSILEKLQKINTLKIAKKIILCLKKLLEEKQIL